MQLILNPVQFQSAMTAQPINFDPDIMGTLHGLIVFRGGECCQSSPVPTSL